MHDERPGASAGLPPRMKSGTRFSRKRPRPLGCGRNWRSSWRPTGPGGCIRRGSGSSLTGATNAGKSSLFNLFLKEERAIVSEIHGTTRDYLESWLSIDGIPVSLYDTAGLRKADNPVRAGGDPAEFRRSSGGSSGPLCSLMEKLALPMKKKKK